MADSALRTVLAAVLFVFTATLPAGAQEPPPADTAAPPPAETTAPTPADPPPGELPPVQVIQKKQPAPAKKAAKKAAPKKKTTPVSPVPVSPPPVPPEAAEAEPAPADPNPIYGARNSGGAAARAATGAVSPVNPTSIIPSNLEKFAGAATNVTPEMLKEWQPSNMNQALTHVPGIIVINDDGNAHHGGIAIRGSPARRSRKILTMEDGHPVNLALWLDPSVHFIPPIDRIESYEVIRGTVIAHGPNNNFGVINMRNLSPFGPEESVVSSAIGFTRNKAGSFAPAEAEGPGTEPEFDEDDRVFGSSDTDISTRWHVHTRQHAENVGVVASYTGANVQGAWDTERLRFNDFYGAVGWKGITSDLVVSASYSRQRDNYDEQNFLGNYELGENFSTDEATAEAQAEAVAEQFIGLAERQFRTLKHCKTCFVEHAGLNTYNGDIWRGQIVHNAYLDDDTTVTTRLYAGHHRRDRYQLMSFESAPDGTPGGDPPVFAPDLNTEPGGLEDSSVFFGENTMFGRLRTFRHLGGEVRVEWANRNILGFNQDIQAGIRYEYQDMTNRNFIGLENEILKDGDEAGATIFDRELDANAVSAFLQTNVKVATDFNVVPGIRFEWYETSRRNRVVAREESEAGGGDDEDCELFFGEAPCLEIDGLVLNPDPARERFSNFHALPGIAFAYTGLKRTTVFGGYHRGMSTGVLRNEDFPVDDEIGDNFNLGLRSTAIRGLDFEVAGFYQLLHDYQFGASFNAAVDRSFGRAEEVEISGVELYGRLNSQPYTGGTFNFFAEGNYMYSRGIFKKATAFDDDGEPEGNFNGNRIPEVPLHVAALTLGVERRTGWRWDASVTWTYRGSFFTDEANTPFGFGGELECEAEEDGDPHECEIEEAGEDGEVPSIWLLSARINLDIGDTGASVFLAGDNLLDKLYISDREDGMKPGMGRTIWAGFKWKF